MKTTIYLFAAILLLVSFASAGSYKSSYVVDGWLEVTRAVQTAELVPCMVNGVTGVCGATGAVQTGKTSNAIQTTIALTLRNIGTADRDDLTVSESLASIPNGAQTSFSPVPYYSDGRTATWSIGTLMAGQAKTVAYSFLAAIPESAVARLPQPSIGSRPLEVTLSAPEGAKVGERIIVSLHSASGQPVSGATIYVVYPDGDSEAVKTGNEGKAGFSVIKEGFYTYNVASYRLALVPSTSVTAISVKNESVSVPVTAAAAADGGLAQSLLGMLPIAAAMLVMAFILMLVYNFLSTKDESQEESGEGGQKEQSQLVYTQKFSFAEDARKDQRVQDMTRDIIGSRKRQMQSPQEESEEKEGQQMEKEAAAPEPQAEVAKEQPFAIAAEQKHSEETRNYDTHQERIESEIAEEADEGGGATKVDDESIEATIARLEEIRERLRAARAASGGEPQQDSKEGEPEGENLDEGPEEGADDSEPEAAEPVIEDEAQGGSPEGEETVESGEGKEPAAAPVRPSRKLAKRKLPRHKPKPKSKPAAKKKAKARKK